MVSLSAYAEGVQIAHGQGRKEGRLERDGQKLHPRRTLAVKNGSATARLVRKPVLSKSLCQRCRLKRLDGAVCVDRKLGPERGGEMTECTGLTGMELGGEGELSVETDDCGGEVVGV